MSLRLFGSTGVSVPHLGLGTWQMEEDDPESAIRALHAGLELGLTHVDTAELYGSGQVETLVGRAIAGQRERIFLVSKVLPTNATRQGTLRACEASLKRLGTDHLDCYLLHWPGSHSLEGTLDAFEALVKKGHILSYGVSNFDATELAEAVDLVGPGRIACNQVLYHLAERTIEHEVVPYCEANQIAVVGYTPFGRGPFPPAASPDGGTELERIARERGVSPRQIALAFLTRRASMFAIPKSSDPAHVRENAGAASLELGPSDCEALERAFPLGRKRRGVATL